MPEDKMSELDEHEPELEEMSDYDKPLSKSKKQWIFIAFLIALIVYLLYSILMSSI